MSKKGNLSSNLYLQCRQNNFIIELKLYFWYYSNELGNLSVKKNKYEHIHKSEAQENEWLT